MYSYMNRFQDLGLLLLRLGFGTMYVIHGYPKLQAGTAMWEQLGMAMGNLGITFAPVFWGFMAMLAEFLGGILLALGFFARPACLFMAFTMLVATVMHLTKGDGFLVASHAIENGIVLFSLIFIGPGRYSVDAFRARPSASDGGQ